MSCVNLRSQFVVMFPVQGFHGIAVGKSYIILKLSLRRLVFTPYSDFLKK